jgi:hypothetical protein
MKSPVSVHFKSLGAGEWSETIRSMVPSMTAAHSFSCARKKTAKLTRIQSYEVKERYNLIVFASNGRAAFKLSGSSGNIFGCQSQIMRAGFYGQRDAALLGFSNQRDRVGARQVHDVTGNSGTANAV